MKWTYYLLRRSIRNAQILQALGMSCSTENAFFDGWENGKQQTIQSNWSGEMMPADTDMTWLARAGLIYATRQ